MHGKGNSSQDEGVATENATAIRDWFQQPIYVWLVRE